MRARPFVSISSLFILIAGVTTQPAAAGTGTGTYSTIGGGNANTASATYTTVGGGNANSATNLGATIGGGHSNSSSGYYSTIAGGYDSKATGNYATLGGGQYNAAEASHATVAGGQANAASAESATVAGGAGNVVSASYGTIAGGGLNNSSSIPGNRVTDSYGTVGGGSDNQAGNGTSSLTDRAYATVAGGLSNTASGPYASIGGGASNAAIASHATIAGGLLNGAKAAYATVAGGYGNTAGGTFSFAAGRQAKATHTGSFVWGDNTASYVTSTGPNQFIARASGGVTFYSNPGTTAGVTLPPGGGAWSNLSDRAAKDNFAAVDSTEVLERVASMPIQRWNYKSQDTSVKHIGPMAQDFAAAFGVGENDTTISTVDADGVALAAIQGLYQENQQLKRDLAALKAKVDAIAGLPPHAETTER